MPPTPQKQLKLRTSPYKLRNSPATARREGGAPGMSTAEGHAGESNGPRYQRPANPIRLRPQRTSRSRSRSRSVSSSSSSDRDLPFQKRKTTSAQSKKKSSTNTRARSESPSARLSSRALKNAVQSTPKRPQSALTMSPSKRATSPLRSLSPTTRTTSPIRSSPQTSPRTVSKSSYTYTSLAEINQPRRSMEPAYVNIFGVFIMASRIKESKTVIELRDESLPEFGMGIRVEITEKASSIPLLEFGDVVRIHRLMVDFGSMRIFDPNGVAIFKGFGPHSQNQLPKHVSKTVTLTDADHSRRRELDSWFADRLLSRTVSTLATGPRFTTLVGKVFAIVGPDSYPRATLALCDGTVASIETVDPMQDQQRYPNATAILRRTDNLATIQAAQARRGITFVNLYEQRARDIKDLPLESIIVINNVDVQRHKRIPGMWDVSLHASDSWGKALRIAHANSDLGRKLTERVDTFLTNNVPPAQSVDAAEEELMAEF